MRPRRVVSLVAVILGTTVAVLGWGIPNLAGPALIDVQVVALPVSGGGASADRTIVFGDGEPTTAARLQLAVRVTGRYPLPVTVGTTAMPLRVELWSQASDGTSKLVWAIEGSAAAVEEGIDSPDGGAVSRVYLVAPGSIELAIGDADGVPLFDVDGRPLATGRYDLRAIAFGVASGLLPMALLD